MTRKPMTTRIDKAMTIDLAHKFGKSGTREIEIDLMVEEIERRGGINSLSLRKSHLARKKRWIRAVLENAVDEQKLPIFVNLRLVGKHGRVYHAYKPRQRMNGPEYIQADP
jgi:hypothetical protein